MLIGEEENCFAAVCGEYIGILDGICCGEYIGMDETCWGGLIGVVAVVWDGWTEIDELIGLGMSCCGELIDTDEGDWGELIIEIEVGGRGEVIDTGDCGEVIIGIDGGCGGVIVFDTDGWNEPIIKVCWEGYIGCGISVFGVNWGNGVTGDVKDCDTEIASFVFAGSIIGGP